METLTFGIVGFDLLALGHYKVFDISSFPSPPVVRFTFNFLPMCPKLIYIRSLRGPPCPSLGV